MAERVEHWFNRRYGMSRRDVFLLRTETGWQVLGRQGGADGQEVAHYFDREDDARAMLATDGREVGSRLLFSVTSSGRRV